MNLQWFTSPEWANVVKALLHTLWQGALIAVLLGLALRRLENPVARYRSSLAALAGVLVAGLVTWAVLNRPVPMPAASAPAPAVAAVDEPVVQSNLAPLVVQVTAIKSKGVSLGWTAWLALVWLAGTTVMIGRAGYQVAGAERLRRAAQPFEDERIAELLAEARRAVGLARRVRLAVTDKLTSPAVVGVLVPTLILPLSLASTLSPEQIRFILLHELAHIRRGDYFANLFQLFAEALLFFNPAVWWISRHMRLEREACCDALAIELSGAPADYARTLVHVAENVLVPPSAAAPAFGDKREPSSLADRVQRLLVPGYRPQLRLTWRAMLTALFVGGTLLTLSAIGTRVTVAAILSPQQRIDRIEKKMTELGQKPVAVDFSGNGENAPQVKVSGVIRTKDGTPVPKWVYVNLTSLIPRSSYGSSLAAKAGKFSGTIRAGTIYLGVEVTNFAPTVLGPLDGLATNRFENLDLVLDRGFDVPLQLVDADSGLPVPAANVCTMFWMNNEGFQAHVWQAGADGIVTLTHCADFPVDATVNAPGYVITKKRFDHLSAGEPLRLALRRGEPVSGTVLDKATGEPLAGAELHLLYQMGGESGANYGWDNSLGLMGVTDANGNFSLNRLRRGEHYFIGVTAPGHESVMVSKVVANQGKLEVQLGPELIVHGHVTGHLERLRQYGHERVLDRNWNEVYDNNSQGFSERVPVQMTNGAATFVFTNRTPGPVTLSGENYGETREVTAPVDDWVVNLAAPETAEAVAAKVVPKREVVFRFKHPSGVPPRGTVQVEIPDNLDINHLTAHYQTLEFTNGEVHVQIAIGGRTAIEPKRMVGYWFDRGGNNGNLFSLPVTNGTGPMVIDIPLVPAGAIYAKARNADGTPAGGVFFGVTELKRAPGRDQNSLDSGGDGFSDNAPRQWVSGPLPLGGKYQIQAWRGNAFCVSEPVKLTEANPDAEVELQFAPGKKFMGQVMDAEGKPLRDAELKPLFTLAENQSFGLTSLYSNDRGWFELGDANPELGEYSVEVNGPGTLTERIVLDFKTQPQIIRLKRGHSLAGRVTEAGTGYAIPGAEVRALDYDRNKLPMVTTHTDADGRFEFNTLGDVNYTLYVEDAEIISDKKHRADGSTNVVLSVKLHGWSKVKPKVAVATTNDLSAVLADPNHRITLAELTAIMTNQTVIATLVQSGRVKMVKGRPVPNDDVPGAIWDTSQESRSESASESIAATQVATNVPPPHFEQRLQTVIQRGDNTAQTTAATDTNLPQVLITVNFYEARPADFKDVVTFLKFNTDDGGLNSWAPLSANQFGHVRDQFNIPTFHKISTPRVVTSSGQEARMYKGDGTNGITFDCTPVVTNGQVNLAFDFQVVQPDAGAWMTNQFHTVAMLENRGGVLVNTAAAGGTQQSNVVAFVGVEIITNDAARFQQRLQTVIKRGPDDNTGSPSYTAGHQKIIAKLKAIRLDRVDSAGQGTLGEMVRQLNELARQKDPERTGVAISIATNSFTAVSLDLDSVHVKFSLVDVRLTDVLDAMLLVADKPLQYNILDSGVVFSARDEKTLYTRSYQVDKSKFIACLKNMDITSTSTNPADEISDMARKYFVRSLRVNLDSPPGKTVSFDDDNSLLSVKASQSELNNIGESLQMIIEMPPSKRGINHPMQGTSAMKVMVLAPDGSLREDKARQAAVDAGENMMMSFKVDSALPGNQLQQALLDAGVKIPPTTWIYNSGAGALLVQGTADQLVLATRAVYKLNGLSAGQIEAVKPDYVKAASVVPPTDASTNMLYARTYKVETRTFIGTLKSMGMVITETTNLSREISAAARTLFRRLGVNWEAPPGKTVFFNDKTGMFFVKACESDLAVIDRALQTINQTAPQVHIKARFLEVTRGTVVGLGNMVNSTNATAAEFTGILDEAKTKAMLRWLSTGAGFATIGEPEVVILSGRQCQMRATQTISVISNMVYQAGPTNGSGQGAIIPQINQCEVGPILDVVPYVLADGYTINLTVTPMLNEFLGYDNGPAVPNLTGTNNIVQLPAFYPHFSKRQMTATLNLRDNQTVIIGGMPEVKSFTHKVPVLGSVPLMGRMFRSENTTTNEILVFVTATIVDPAGNRVHTEEESSHFQIKAAPDESHFQIKAAPDTFPTGGGGGRPF